MLLSVQLQPRLCPYLSCSRSWALFSFSLDLHTSRASTFRYSPESNDARIPGRQLRNNPRAPTRHSPLCLILKPPNPPRLSHQQPLFVALLLSYFYILSSDSPAIASYTTAGSAWDGQLPSCMASSCIPCSVLSPRLRPHKCTPLMLPVCPNAVLSSPASWSRTEYWQLSCPYARHLQTC